MRENGTAFLSQPSHVEDREPFAFEVRCHPQQLADRHDAGAAHAGDNDPIRPVGAQRWNGRLGQIRNASARVRFALFQLSALDSDKARAETFQTRVILVATRLIDLALAAELGLQWLDRQAVRFQIAITAALAHQLVDDNAPRRIGKVSFLGRVLLAAPPLLRRTGLVIDHDGHTAMLAQLELYAIKIVAVVHGDALGKPRIPRILVRLVGDDHDLAHALGRHLLRDHRH